MPINNKITETHAARRMERINASISISGIYLGSLPWAINASDRLWRRSGETESLQYFPALRPVDELQKQASRVFVLRSLEQHDRLSNRRIAIRGNFPFVSIV